MVKAARVFLAGVVLGGLCLTTDALARGGGGGHGGGGGGHFGGGGGHFGGGATSVVAAISAERILAAVPACFMQISTAMGSTTTPSAASGRGTTGAIVTGGPAGIGPAGGTGRSSGLTCTATSSRTRSGPAPITTRSGPTDPMYFLSGIYWPGPYYADGSGGQYHGPYDVYGAGAPPAASAVQSGIGPTDGELQRIGAGRDRPAHREHPAGGPADRRSDQGAR